MAPPNIILILTDHFRRDALGPHTPHLLRLAAGGVRFASAYCAAPLCQPARTSLIAGAYPSFTGICGNQSDPMSDAWRDDTFMQHLQRAGYYTALIGKHHYLDRYGIGMDVTADDAEIRRYGFDAVCQVVDDGENSHNDDEYTRDLAARGLLEPFRRALKAGGFQHPFAAEDSADGFIGRHGVRFVAEYDRSQPFYLNLGFIGPHPPYWHPGELTIDPATVPAAIGATDDPATRERRAHYLQKTALIDRYVGELVETLGRRGLLEHTVIVFTSDHGDMLGDFGLWDKRFFFEASVGVPLIMRGPGVPREERLNGPLISRQLVSHLDLYPTFLRLAGIEPARDRHRPGRDILALLRGEVRRHDAVYAELATCAMIRTAGWKLMFDPEQGGVQQLFNLAADPQELHNLAGAAGYEHTTLDLVSRLLAQRIRLTQFTHIKEEQRLQRVRAG
jgi:arylsulfatase A-like enzyme